MARKASALVVTLDEAAELLISKTSFIKREIREGTIKAIKLGSQTVIRKDELKAYLERKEAEGIPAKKPRTSSSTKEPNGDAALDETSVETEPELPFLDIETTPEEN